jgi:class 3 adenylate cyclase/TolB-like protein/Tfp pilus assembly protein PilF
VGEHRVERKLSAILAADVVGYGRLMGADEAGTLRALKTLRRELFEPGMTAHGGRIVKLTGDGILIEFASAVDAVAYAIEVQHAMVRRNAATSPERRIEYRVGINIGDVIVDGDDIYGDGVNVAARLEALAEPGGVWISGSVYEQVRDKLRFAFVDKGEQAVKNISRPVHVYAFAPEAVAALAEQPAPLDTSKAKRRRGLRSIWPMAVGLAAALILSVGIWVALKSVQLPQMAGPAARFSLVVLPFVNLGGDPTQDYLADVLTDELTTGLSRLPDSFVIARSTAFTWKGKPIDARQIGKDLGVRYVVEGSVQPSSDRLRVNAQLIDAEKNAHLWVDQFDENRVDLLQMQDDIVTRLAWAIGWKMTVEEAGRAHARAANPNAQDLSWRCYATTLRADLATKDRDAGYRLCEEALQMDPGNILALSTLSLKFSQRAALGSNSSDRQADVRRADELASAALRIDPNSFLAHGAKGDVLREQSRFREAIEEYQRELSLNPSMIPAYGGLSYVHNYLGEPELAIAEVDKAMRLSPHDPSARDFYFHNSMSYGMMEDYEQALTWMRRAYAVGPPDFPLQGFYQASLLALAGHDAEARATMERYLAGNAPIRTVAQLRRIRNPGSDAPRFLAFREKFEEGLRKAGMPEE